MSRRTVVHSQASGHGCRAVPCPDYSPLFTKVAQHMQVLDVNDDAEFLEQPVSEASAETVSNTCKPEGR